MVSPEENIEAVKSVYEISKLTNTTKQILDDFNTSITMLMFTQFLKTNKNPSNVLEVVLDKWEKAIIFQKHILFLLAVCSYSGGVFSQAAVLSFLMSSVERCIHI